MEAVSTCTFTARIGEDAEKHCGKCTAVVLTKCLPGAGPWESSLHGASLLGLTPAKHFLALGKDRVPGPASLDLPAQASQASMLFQCLHE